MLILSPVFCCHHLHSIPAKRCMFGPSLSLVFATSFGQNATAAASSDDMKLLIRVDISKFCSTAKWAFHIGHAITVGPGLRGFVPLRYRLSTASAYSIYELFACLVKSCSTFTVLHMPTQTVVFSEIVSPSFLAGVC